MRITILILFITLSSFKPGQVLNLKAKTFKTEIKAKYKYNEAIELVKKYEGFRSEKYELFGRYYIGYGHLITSKENFNSLTESQATELLKKDFNKGLKQVKKYARGSNDNKRLVLACYIYNCGIGSLVRSGLIKDLTNYKKTCFVGGIWFKSLEKRRIDELNLL